VARSIPAMTLSPRLCHGLSDESRGERLVRFTYQFPLEVWRCKTERRDDGVTGAEVENDEVGIGCDVARAWSVTRGGFRLHIEALLTTVQG
jgi:hypothetical protein